MRQLVKQFTLHDKKRFGRLMLTLILFLVLITAALTTMTAAKYVHSSNVMKDTYQPDTYDVPLINETVTTTADGFYTNTYLSVTPADTTDYPVYVRLALLPVWCDAQGNILGRQPMLGTDYSLSCDTAYWLYHNDGYYYCTKAVIGGQETPPLLSGAYQIVQIKAAPQEGYTLKVMVAVETIQAIGSIYENQTAAVVDAWGQQPAAAE